MVNWIHLLFLKVKAEASKQDNPNLWQAMNGPFADKYWKAAVKEIRTLEIRAFGTWSIGLLQTRMSLNLRGHSN